VLASWSPVIEPGFFSSAPVQIGLIVGGIVALVSAVVGTFTVIRGQSFAGHSLADIGTAGGSAALLAGVPVLYGFVAMNLAAAGTMELIGIRRPRGRDLATGIVLGASLGLAALFLYLDSTSSTTTGATVTVLFGSLFTVSASTVPVIAVLGGMTLATMAVLYRPLLLSSVNDELAAARGVPVRLVGVAYLGALAIAVSLSAVTIGAILSTALLIGPAATSLRITRRTGTAVAIASVIGVVATWLGILLAYDTAAWSSQGQGWPVSFCVVAVIFTTYVLVSLPASLATRRRAAVGGSPSAAAALAAR
jgi:zinc/manganese transport system permease protein